MNSIFNYIKGDKVIWIVVILLSVFSVMAVYSSTGLLAFNKQEGNTEFYLTKQIFIVVFGILLMYLAHLIKYSYYSRIFQVALYIAVPLLFLTLIFGQNINDANRTLKIWHFTLQTSDLAKLTLIIYLARILTKKQEVIKDFKSAFIPIMAPVLVVCFLILPANLSTAAILFATSLILMFVGRVNMKHILSFLGIGIVALAFLVLLTQKYPHLLPRLNTWTMRIERFIDSDETKEYEQVTQAKIAIASGGIFGKMPGMSTQRNFISHPYSDFIFAIIVEEYGLAGGIGLVMLYLILLFRATIIVNKCPRNFGAFLSIGVAFSLVFQAFINMGVAVNLLPVTGQTLPLVSMGGSSVWFTSIALGIMLSVSKEVENNPEMVTA